MENMGSQQGNGSEKDSTKCSNNTAVDGGVTVAFKESCLVDGCQHSKNTVQPGPGLGLIVNIKRVVVVTGVSMGIGHGIAKTLIAHQCHVFGSVRKEADAMRLKAEFGDLFTPLLFDVTDEEAVLRAAAEVRPHMKGHCLMGLVNNAGIHVGLEAVADLPLGKLRKQLEVNLIAQVSVTQAFLPLLGTDLTLKGKPGKILNISSIYAGYTLPFSAAYSASKAGLNALSEGLRRELKPFGIDVVIIAPGPIRTKIWTDAIQNGEQTGKTGSLFSEYLLKAHHLSDKETSKPGWFWEPSAVGKCIWKVLRSRSPPVHVVVTPKWWLNWFGPTFFPRHMVDREVCRRFRLTRPLARGQALPVPVGVKEV